VAARGSGARRRHYRRPRRRHYRRPRPGDRPDCVGIIVVSWSSTKVVLKFGNAYGTFDHWYLTNGDEYALSIKTAIWGSTVSALS
jgi:hypothetical protein